MYCILGEAGIRFRDVFKIGNVLTIFIRITQGIIDSAWYTLFYSIFLLMLSLVIWFGKQVSEKISKLHHILQSLLKIFAGQAASLDCQGAYGSP